MIRAYKEIYLKDAMTNLGEMTEYAHDACGFDVDDALRMFVISGYADRFGKGDPSVVCGRSGTELFQDISDKCGIQRTDWPKAIVKYTTEEYYWIGYILAYFQWTYNKTFGNIIESIKAEDLLNMYPALHTASEDKAIEVIKDLYDCRNRKEDAEMKIEVLRAEEEWQRAGAYSVRIEGRNRQHHISLREEFDEHDCEGTRYIVLLDEGYPIATCRFFDSEDKDKVILGRVVVLPEYRNKGLGIKVMDEAEAWIKELGYTEVIIDSRTNVVGFYEKLGYKLISDHEEMSGCFECIRMSKKL